MIRGVRRTFSVYGPFAAMVPKMFMAYSIWVWMQLFVQIISLVIFVAFWEAVYTRQDTIGGLGLQQTLNYIILAQIFIPTVTSSNVLFYFGEVMREGRIGIDLLRPMDFQGAQYVSHLSNIAVSLFVQIPLAVIAWLMFRFQIPADPALLPAFVLTLLLGTSLVFFFDWIIGCLAFYTTEVWGLMVLRFGVATFFSGSLIPLTMMPEWLQGIANAMPFSQALYVPVALISGILPLTDMPRIWLIQMGSLVLLILASRAFFQYSVRRVTVQGG